jgi:tetratricopeptide (TPR) repeat protein
VTHDIEIPEKINHQDYHRSIATTLGEVYYRDGNYQLAQAYFQKALREPYQYQNAYLHYLMYHCYQALGEPTMACYHLEEAKELDRKFKRFWKDNCK